MKVHMSQSTFACGHNTSAGFRDTRCGRYLLRLCTTTRWAKVTCERCKRARGRPIRRESDFCMQCQGNFTAP